MIDTTALTALITAFRAEVTQNSISPEKVGSILQQIADIMASEVHSKFLLSPTPGTGRHIQTQKKMSTYVDILLLFR